jgi:3-phosphoshikimate 1-carboxyvinyltransferase
MLSNPLKIENLTKSQDILATYNALTAIRNGERVLDAGESGSTLRFLIPLVATLKGDFQIKTHGKLGERPNDDLYNAINGKTVNAYTKNDVVYVNGTLTAGHYEIRADKSSQYLSGLIMALSGLEEKSTIKVLTPISSSPYVDITVNVLESFGFNVEFKNDTFTVGGKRQSTLNPNIEGDWSNSAFFLVAGVINGDVTVKNLNQKSVQGDMAIVDIIKSAGGNISINGGDITAKKSTLKGFTMNAENCPDLVPICAVLGAYSNGITTITNVKRLKLKESDRIVSTMCMLKSAGVKCEEINDSIIIYGGEVFGGEIDSFNDHRIAMSSAILALNAKGDIKITGANAVNKSYPNFYLDFNKLGGKAIEIV